MRRTVALIALLGAIALLAGGRSPADDKKGAADAKAAMEAMIKAATPGEPHKRLESMAGTWDVSMQFWMDPSAPPTEAKMTTESKIIMDGRYLEEKVSGEFGGMKFQGQSLVGYDNLQKKYTFAWIDNMGTGISTASGTYDPDKKTITYQGEEIDPASGQKMKNKMVVHLIDKDKFEEDMYKVVGDKDIRVMHLTCVRKAAK